MLFDPKACSYSAIRVTYPTFCLCDDCMDYGFSKTLHKYGTPTEAAILPVFTTNTVFLLICLRILCVLWEHLPPSRVSHMEQCSLALKIFLFLC